MNHFSSLPTVLLPGDTAEPLGGLAGSPSTSIDRVGADFHFGLGLDTSEIAKLRMQPEFMVLRELSVLRSKRLGLAIPYPLEERPTKPAVSSRARAAQRRLQIAEVLRNSSRTAKQIAFDFECSQALVYLVAKRFRIAMTRSE